jgi:hypothetical protein
MGGLPSQRPGTYSHSRCEGPSAVLPRVHALTNVSLAHCSASSRWAPRLCLALSTCLPASLYRRGKGDLRNVQSVKFCVVTYISWWGKCSLDSGA